MRLRATLFLLGALVAAPWLIGGPAAAGTAEPAEVYAPTSVAPMGASGSVSPASASLPSDGFAPAVGPPKERVPGGPLVIWAYALMWLLLIAFLVVMYRRQEAIREELKRIRQRQDELGREEKDS